MEDRFDPRLIVLGLGRVDIVDFLMPTKHRSAARSCVAFQVWLEEGVVIRQYRHYSFSAHADDAMAEERIVESGWSYQFTRTVEAILKESGFLLARADLREAQCTVMLQGDYGNCPAVRKVAEDGLCFWAVDKLVPWLTKYWAASAVKEAVAA
jgi:hypothetical protein